MTAKKQPSKAKATTKTATKNGTAKTTAAKAGAKKGPIKATGKAQLTATVVSARKNIAGAGVVLTNVDRLKTEIAFSNDKGVCVFNDLVDGRYSVTAIDNSKGTVMGQATNYLMISSDKQKYKVALEMGKTGGIGNISVRVTAGGNPVQGAMVNVKSADSSTQYDETKVTSLPNGNAGFIAPNGAHKITVALPPSSSQTQTIVSGSDAIDVEFQF